MRARLLAPPVANVRRVKSLAMGYTVATGVAALRFRFFDGEGWSDSFDSSKSGTLPVAIEVGVWSASGGAASTGEVGKDIGAVMRAPDRWRLITVPDGPVAGWKEGAS